MSCSNVTKVAGTACKIPSLGRSFHLGMLYNLPKDEIVAGMTLWGGATLKNNLLPSPNFNCMYRVKSIDTTEERLKSLNIDGDTSLSAICNLVTAEGAAKFLQSKKASEGVARVTMEYHVQTYFSELPMETLGKLEYPDCLNHVDATHVVAGIQYGADAFFVFEKELCETENKYEVEGRMEFHISQLIPLGVDLKPGAKLGNEQVQSTENFNCTYFGDIVPDQNPSNQDEAIKLYKNIKDHLGKDFEKAVPKVIYLVPLNTILGSIAISKKISSIFNRVSNGLVRHTHDLLDSFEELEVSIIDVQKQAHHLLPDRFGNISRNIDCFKKIVSDLKANFLLNLAVILPKIRTKEEDESKLVEIVQIFKIESPTCLKSLESWLVFKKNEIEHLKKVLDMIFEESKDIKCAFGSSVAFDQLVNDPRSSSPLISLHICLTSRNDPLLQAFEVSSFDDFMMNTKQNDHFLQIKNGQICPDLRQNVIQFTQLISANRYKDVRFVVTDDAGSDSFEHGSRIMLYQFHKNQITRKELKHLEQPDKPIPSGVDDSSITLTWSSHDLSCYPQTPMKGYKLYYRRVAGVKEDWTTKTVTGNSTRITHLLQKSKYEFKIAPDFGSYIGIASIVSCPVTTKEKVLPRRRSSLCLPPKRPSASVIANNEAYRKGYPDKRDDPNINHNYEFFTNMRRSRPKGDLIDNIHTEWWGQYQLLESHDLYTQWLFPTRSGPGVNTEAKELQPHEIEKILHDPKAIGRLIKSYQMMLDFFGLELVDSKTGEVRRSGKWKERLANLNTSQKNHLRLTRILRCLGELGLEHFKPPLVKHLLTEIIVEGTLESCLTSCLHYWIEVLKDDEERIKLQKYAEELFQAVIIK